MSPYPHRRSGEITWDGVSTLISEHVDFNNEHRLNPRFDALEDRVKETETKAMSWTQFLESQEKREKRNAAYLKTILTGVVLMCAKFLADYLQHSVHFK